MPAILTAELAALLGVDVTMAGYILGGILTMALLLAVLIMSSLAGNDESSAPIMISMGLGFILSVAFGWFALWTVIIVGMLIALMLIGPFRD